MIYTDRSRIVARNECGRLGYLAYEAGGKGWAPKTTPLPLANGIVIHDAFAGLLCGEKVETVIGKALTAYWKLWEGNEGWEKNPELFHLYHEQQMMIMGIIYTFNYIQLPKLQEEFVVAYFPNTQELWVEKEFTVEVAPGISTMLRMDAVLRRRTTGELVILDFKTLSYLSADWMEKWKHNAQTYLYTHAVKMFSGEEVEGIMYLGIIKGMRRKETSKVPWKGYKVQVSPYCYGYQDENTGAIQLDYTSKKGYKKIAAWEVLSAFGWFEEVLKPAHWDNDLFNTLFCMVPPYSPVQWEVERWIRQMSWQEYLLEQYKKEIADATQRGHTEEAERLKEIYFPTNEERCFKYGQDNQCVYIPLCFSRDPKPEQLNFIQRTPHHETEVEKEV